MSSIIIIAGTDRPNSNALRVSQFVQKKYESLGIQPKIVSLENYPFQAIIGGSYDSTLPEVVEFNKPILEADGLIFVVPEYNGSFPGVLKLMLDYMPFPQALIHKPIAYIGEASGAFGALRAIEQLQMIMNYRNALNYPERVFIQRISKDFNDEEGPTDPLTSKLLHEQCEGFLEFVKMHTKVSVE